MDGSSNNPRETALSALFDLVATTLAEKIRSGEATSADLSTARQMLKDNNIDCARDHKPILNLADHVPFTDDEIDTPVAEGE